MQCEPRDSRTAICHALKGRNPGGRGVKLRPSRAAEGGGRQPGARRRVAGAPRRRPLALRSGPFGASLPLADRDCDGRLPGRPPATRTKLEGCCTSPPSGTIHADARSAACFKASSSASSDPLMSWLGSGLSSLSWVSDVVCSGSRYSPQMSMDITSPLCGHRSSSKRVLGKANGGARPFNQGGSSATKALSGAPNAEGSRSHWPARMSSSFCPMSMMTVGSTEL